MINNIINQIKETEKKAKEIIVSSKKESAEIIEKTYEEAAKILKEAEGLGSGYKIALKDLEIRGAGNILGKEQSGNINKVGLNLYCQMLSEIIEKLKNC